MSDIKKLLLFIFVTFCLIMPVYAASNYLVLLDSVNIRSGPSVSYKRLELGKLGSTYNLKNDSLISDENKDGSCDAGWYEIDYNGGSAYVCSEYVRVYTSSESDKTEATNTCEAELKEAGFPSSYWSGLCSLKSKHPNWTFKPIITHLDWATAVSKESPCGKSLISTTNSEYLDSTCSIKEGSFKAASRKAVAFYMDPRNFFTEQYIFQFEYLKYEPSLASSYTEAITKMLNNAAFYKFHTDKGIDFASLTTDAGKEKDISPISLAARMYQELGAGTELVNLYSGEYTGSNNTYYGLYNFYNIGVTDSCANTRTICGLTKALKNGWNTPYKAILGGADLLSNNYLANGQFNPYLEKFNVAPVKESSIFLNQYMTNIAAPSSESSTTYNTYNKIGLLDSSFAFYIPVYENMGTTITNNSSGATGGSSASEEVSDFAPTSIITSSGYKHSGSYILGIDPSTTVNDFIGRLEAVAGTGNIIVKDKNGNNATNKIGTGYKVTIKGATESTFEVIIYGDTSGDGEINPLDLLVVQRHILKTESLTNSYQTSADVNKDNKINSLDLLLIQRHILKTENIKQ